MFKQNDKYNVNISIIDEVHSKFTDIINKAIVAKQHNNNVAGPKTNYPCQTYEGVVLACGQRYANRHSPGEGVCNTSANCYNCAIPTPENRTNAPFPGDVYSPYPECGDVTLVGPECTANAVCATP